MSQKILSAIIIIGVITLTYFLLFSNLDIISKSIIYFSSGLMGHFMMEKYLPEGNKSRKEGLMLGYWFYIFFLAPMWFAVGIIAFMITKIK